MVCGCLWLEGRYVSQKETKRVGKETSNYRWWCKENEAFVWMNQSKKTTTYIIFITNWFHKHVFDTQSRQFQYLHNMFPTFLGRIGRIECRNSYTFTFHIFQQIRQGRITRHRPGGHTGYIVRVVPLCRLYGPAQLTSIIPDIEYLGGYIMKEG